MGKRNNKQLDVEVLERYNIILKYIQKVELSNVFLIKTESKFLNKCLIQGNFSELFKSIEDFEKSQETVTA